MKCSHCDGRSVDEYHLACTYCNGTGEVVELRAGKTRWWMLPFILEAHGHVWRAISHDATWSPRVIGTHVALYCFTAVALHIAFFGWTDTVK